jgi:hypothetical protein
MGDGRGQMGDGMGEWRKGASVRELKRLTQVMSFLTDSVTF